MEDRARRYRYQKLFGAMSDADWDAVNAREVDWLLEMEKVEVRAREYVDSQAAKRRGR